MHRTQETSVKALSQSTKTRKNCQSSIILALAGGKRMTCQQLGYAVQHPHQTTSAAISALRDKGQIVDSGERYQATGKRDAILWRLATAADVGKPVLKNGWREWADEQPPEGMPFLIRDHQDVYNGTTYMLDQHGPELRIVRVLEAKWHQGQWHCTGSITGRDIETPLAWRPLPTA